MCYRGHTFRGVGRIGGCDTAAKKRGAEGGEKQIENFVNCDKMTLLFSNKTIADK